MYVRDNCQAAVEPCLQHRQDVRMFSSWVWGNKTSPFFCGFVPKTNQTLTTALYSIKLKIQQEMQTFNTYNANIYSGNGDAAILPL